MMLLGLQGASAQINGDKMVKIKIILGETTILAMLNNTSTARDLLKRLPVVLNMMPHQNREYYGNIQLDKNSPRQDGYKIGEIGYWSSGNSLVLFYGEGYTDDLIIVGEIISGLDELSHIDGAIQATIEKIYDESSIR